MATLMYGWLKIYGDVITLIIDDVKYIFVFCGNNNWCT
jgi:hypothetical protein